jgi:Domain of unknown function (DUF2760)
MILHFFFTLCGILLLGVGAFTAAQGYSPIPLEVMRYGVLEIGVGALLLSSVFFAFRTLSRVRGEHRNNARQQLDEVSTDLSLLREERDQLASIVRESKEREEALSRALDEAHMRQDALKKKSSDGSTHEGVEVLLSLFQEKGKFLDFLASNPSGFTDEHVGRVARIVHSGCNQVLSEYIELSRIAPEEEGAPMVLQQGYNAQAFRLLGNTPSQLPYKGTLLHRGWSLEKISLPRKVSSSQGQHGKVVLAPAEIETYI